MAKEPTTVTEQVASNFDPRNASPLYGMGTAGQNKPYRSAMGVTLGTTKSAMGVDLPTLIMPQQEAPKAPGIAPASPAAASPAAQIPAFTADQQKAADALYNKAFPVATEDQIAQARENVASLVAGKPESKLTNPEAPAKTIAAETSPAATEAGKPWTQEQRNKHLGIGDFRIVKGAGPEGTDVLTNRETPFRNYKELPSEAYGIGGSKEKEAMMSEYEKEMRTPFASVEKIKAMERRLGIGTEATPFEKGKLALEEKKLQQDAEQFAETHDMNEQSSKEKLLMMAGGTIETIDPNTGETVKRPDLSLLEGAYDEKGKIDISKVLRAKFKRDTIANAQKRKLAGADPEAIKRIMRANQFTEDEIKAAGI